MRIRVVVDQPPMLAEIAAAFPIAGKAILFAWGDRIYNPANIVIPPELLAHEAVHGERQTKWGNSPRHVEGWWRRYIAEPEFRLQEEIPAHVAEFKALCALHAPRWVSHRNMRRHFAACVARKLAAPLYGNLVSVEEAKGLFAA